MDHPKRVAIPHSSTTPLARTFATFARRLDFKDLPSSAIHATKRHLIDALGCAYGALDDDAPVISERLARRVRSEPGAHTLYGSHTSPDIAAFVNGVLIRYLDYNDTYLSLEPAHPSDNIAATLAAAELAHATGPEFITATIAAYEIQCRLADAASIRAQGWDHVCYGAFSTACGAGRLLGLTEEQLVHAQAISAGPHMAMRQTRSGELSMWKGTAFANTARNGVMATLLAADGMTGPAPLFEGEFGFFAQVAGRPFTVAPLGGPDGLAVERTLHKYWPAEYHAQSAIEAALTLRDDLGSHAAIDRIRIDSSDAAVDIIGSGEERWRPSTRETADHSLPYCTAIAFIDGEVGPAQFVDARISDPLVLDVVSRVDVRRNDALTARYPESTSNRVTVMTTDGREISHQVDYPKGHVRNPLSDEELLSKFYRQAEPQIPRRRLDKLVDSLWQLDAVEDMSQLLPAMIRLGSE